MCGDVNGDREVEIVNAVLVGRYVNNNEGLTWAEFCQKQGIKQDAEQALANADVFKPSDFSGALFFQDIKKAPLEIGEHKN